MLRPLLLLLFGVSLIFNVQGQCVPQNLKIKFTPGKICPGAQLSVSTTKSNVYFNSGNQFKFELSDAVGSFATPTLMTTITDTVTGNLTYTVPFNTPPGSLYKIRVTTTSPAHTCYLSDSVLTVYPKPTPNFTFPNDSQCYKYSTYNFTSTSTISSGSIAMKVWNWGDGSNNDTTTIGNTVSHHYKFYNSSFMTELKVISNFGCRDSIKKQVNIREMPIIDADVNDDIQCFRGNLFKIKSTSSTYTGTITSKNWLFGDGSPMVTNKDSVSHKYAAEGIYYVSQINAHSNGCIDTLKIFVLANPHPKAKIITNDTDQCLLGNNFIFESNSTVSNGLPLFNYWNIDIGVNYSQKDSVHYKYKTQGNRTVRLISITDDGADACADTVYQKILVNPMPKVSIINYDNDLCLKGNVFRFKAKSTIASGTITHNWTFGDASSKLNSDSVSHTYLTAGTYSIELKGISAYGCRDSIKTTVVVNPTPVPGFIINQKTQCLKINLFKLKSTSTISSGTYTRLWEISDGSSFSGVDSISTHIASVGVFSAKLFLTSNLNCKDSIVDTLKVIAMPQPSFSINKDKQCFRNNSFDFTDNSTFPSGSILGNKWSFDDGDTAIDKPTINHKYLVEADYNVKLIVYGNNGCIDTATNIVSVYPHPGVSFLINDTGQCVNSNSFIFTSQTFISSGNFTNKWFFGDGTTSTAFSPTKKYTKDSTFVVTNIAFSDHACTDTLKKTVTVYPKPKTAFTIDNDKQCKLGNNFTFVQNTTIKYGTFTVGWNFGDGNVDGNVNSTQHSYNNAQLYKVRLIATSNNGCFDTLIKDARVYPMPVASYNLNYLKSCLKGNNFQVNATSTVSNGSAMKHNWYFGDNDSVINAIITNHTYLSEGQYDIKLVTTTTTGGCKDTTTKAVEVFPMPKASFTIDKVQQCLMDNDFNFSSTSTISNGTISTYNWLFGDNTSATGNNVSHSYTKVDSFHVILTVVSDNNCINADTSEVYINPMPTADFTISPAESCLKNNLFFITDKSKIVKGLIMKYQLYFGDGDSATIKDTVSYSYKASGTYTVNLKVTTDKGCWDTANIIINVNPTPNLDFDVTEVCLKDSTEFTNNSTLSPGIVTSWKWLFGDGRVSSEESPKHKYRVADSFNITLIAVTDKGCRDTLKRLGEAVVNPLPVAKFVYQKLRSWENEVDIQYIDSSKGATKWFWDFSSMGTSTSQNPLIFYTDTLTQNTTLVVYNNFGCTDTAGPETIFIAPDVIFYMPNSFSPGNDDQINDFFKPIGLAYAKSYKFIIFNRWGELLFKTDNPQAAWDGKSGGVLVEQGLYYYRLEFVGSDDLRHEEKGNIMIIR